MKILILNTDYDKFLSTHYGAHPELVGAGYERQLQARIDTVFGMSDFYSRNFRALGHEAKEISVNNIWQQTAWAREHGLPVSDPPSPFDTKSESYYLIQLKRRLRPLKSILKPVARKLGFVRTMGSVERAILLAQIEDFDPDVILDQDIEIVSGRLLHPVRRQNRKIVAQCGVDPPPDMDFGAFDYGVSLIPWVVDYFRRNGLSAERCHLGFEPSLLDHLGPAPNKDVSVSFVGSLVAIHGRRMVWLEEIAKKFDLNLWMPDSGSLPAGSRLRECYRGPAWGKDMYNVIRR